MKIRCITRKWGVGGVDGREEAVPADVRYNFTGFLLIRGMVKDSPVPEPAGGCCCSWRHSCICVRVQNCILCCIQCILFGKCILCIPRAHHPTRTQGIERCACAAMPAGCVRGTCIWFALFIKCIPERHFWQRRLSSTERAVSSYTPGQASSSVCSHSDRKCNALG